MAGIYYTRLKCGLDTNINTARIAAHCGLRADDVVLRLYKLAGWFLQHGNYGAMQCEASTIDFYLDSKGFAEALLAVDWMRRENSVFMLRGFCDQRQRKSLGKTARHKLLHGKACAACGTGNHLVVDHIVPVVRGGSSDECNLQALCWTCNAKKGRKTMQEFMAA